LKYLILGKNGQLGKEFLKTLENQKKDVIGLSRLECDITNFDKLNRVLSQYKPDVVINCTAYNLVDDVEKQYWEAVKVNSIAVKNLAYLSNVYKFRLIHYSTDYVFDGKKENGLYTEYDVPNPINEYGKSKLMGEIFLKEETESHLLFRVSWVYGEGKQNFIYKLLTWAKSNEYLKVAYNEVSVPTSTKTILDITLKALDNDLKGMFHLTNSGYASRYEWAKEIFRIKKIDRFILPVSKEIFNLPAKRPDFSAMSNRKISQVLNTEISYWNEELNEFLKNYEIVI
jgi:dTDP-4-dehydrorhamnose reductase